MGILLGALMAAAATASPPVHYSFEINRANGTLFNPWTLSDDPVRLRSYLGSGAKEGDFVAPEIRVAPGQKLVVDLDNRLEACTDKQRADQACFNDTNLHTHGLWISPSGNSDSQSELRRVVSAGGTRPDTGPGPYILLSATVTPRTIESSVAWIISDEMWPVEGSDNVPGTNRRCARTMAARRDVGLDDVAQPPRPSPQFTRLPSPVSRNCPWPA